MNGATLGVFAKWPRAGQVKTRLAAATSPEWAARTADALLRDTLDRLAGVPAQRIVAFAPADAQADLAALVGDRFALQAQTGGSLGQRMQAFFASCFAAGAERVVLVGSDSPTLPISHVTTAFEELQRVDVVLGPAMDGGYCLVGCAGRVPPIFHGIPWSSARVLHDTVVLLKCAGLRLALLPPWYDVDTLDDLQMLRGHIEALRAAGVEPSVPHCEALLTTPGK